MFTIPHPPKGHHVKVEPVKPNPDVDNSGERLQEKQEKEKGEKFTPVRNIERPRQFFQYHSRKLEESAIIAKSPCLLRHLIGFCDLGGYILTFDNDKTDVTPIHIVPVGAEQFFYLDLPQLGWRFEKGFTVGFSSTSNPFTAGGDHAWFNLVCDLNLL